MPMPISSKDDSKKSFRKNPPFWEGGGLVWCEPDDHPFFWSIHSTKRPTFYLSFSSNYPGAKSVVRHGIEWIPSPAAKAFAFSSVCFFCMLLKLSPLSRCLAKKNTTWNCTVYITFLFQSGRRHVWSGPVVGCPTRPTWRGGTASPGPGPVRCGS